MPSKVRLIILTAKSFSFFVKVNQYLKGYIATGYSTTLLYIDIYSNSGCTAVHPEFVISIL